MKDLFKRSLLLRLVAVLLTLAAPGLSGCEKDDDTAEEAAALEAEYKVIDDGLIQDYLTRKGIGPGSGLNQYEKTESGLYLVRLEEGPAGTNIVSGNRAEIKYVGRFLRETNESTVFDNSTEKGVPCGCFSLLVGAGEVIKGWDEGLLLMKKGDRKLLLIPSYLAYGPAASGSVPANEPLLFDMTVLDAR